MPVFSLWRIKALWGAAAQMRLTLGEAVDLALSENPTIKVAELEIERFDYVKRQTWGNLLPQLSVVRRGDQRAGSTDDIVRVGSFERNQREAGSPTSRRT